MTRRTLLTLGAVFLLIGAAMHAYGWTIVGAKFEGPFYRFSRGTWFALALDWLVVAVIWLMGARGAASNAVVRVATIIPLAMTINAFIVMGPRFIGAWVLLIATVLALAGTMRRR